MYKKMFLGLLIMLLVLAGCGNNGGESTNSGKGAAPENSGSVNEEPVKLRMAWWGGQSRHDATLKVIQLYQKDHPNVDIETEYASFDDYWKKLAPQAAANQLPDIVQMDISYLAQYGERNQLADLSPFVDSGTLNVADINENVLAGGKLNDKLIALGLGVNALASIMDKEMIKNAGVTPPGESYTWDELESLLQQMHDKGGKHFNDLRHDVFFAYYLRTMGATLYKSDGTMLGYDDNSLFIDYFTRYQRWYDAGYLLQLDKQAQKKGTPEDDETVLGNAIASNGWSNGFIGIAEAAARPLELQPLPGPNAEKGMIVKPSMYFSITESSKQKEEAAKFIDFFVNNIEANKIIKGERGVPVSAKIKEEMRPLLSENEAKVYDYVSWAEEHSSPMDPPNPIGSIEVEKLLKDTAEQILFKKVTVEDAAVKFHTEANAILAKNNK